MTAGKAVAGFYDQRGKQFGAGAGKDEFEQAVEQKCTEKGDDEEHGGGAFTVPPKPNGRYPHKHHDKRPGRLRDQPEKFIQPGLTQAVDAQHERGIPGKAFVEPHIFSQFQKKENGR